jgi:hypothetical protein
MSIRAFAFPTATRPDHNLMPDNRLVLMPPDHNLHREKGESDRSAGRGFRLFERVVPTRKAMDKIFKTNGSK